MKTTLLDKWNAIEEAITNLSNEFIDNYFMKKERPKFIYRMSGRQGIEELEVIDFWISRTTPHKPSMEKRPTREKLKALENWFMDFVPDESMLFIRYTGGTGTSKYTGATTFEKIGADKNLSITREELVPAFEEWQKVYGERPGHIPCRYCMKQVLESAAIECTVIARQYPGGRKKSLYCSKECGIHDQWAHEG